MKLIKSTPSKQFKPFRLTLEIESEEEARLLWHCFNRLNLRTAIFDGKNYNSTDEYNMNISSHLNDENDLTMQYIESMVSIDKEVTIEN